MLQAFIALLFGATVLGNDPAPLPTCKEAQQTNSAAYKLQHGGWGTSGFTGARPMKTCIKT